ncbi:Zinc transporter 1 [Smittium culicis]|uniref:Zinc transporter 1 n=1 Tax=Smittium culicis TaxID=133412 RepID=A0A1R1XUU3_9FUNG|nr:Zinc transporter 1 [Smittium culicis]
MKFSSGIKVRFYTLAVFLASSICASSTTTGNISQSLIEKRQGHSHAGHSHGPTQHSSDGAEELNCSASGISDWSLSLQLISFFVIMFAGGIGAFIPVIGYHVRSLRLPTNLIDAMKFFGIGVILSTAIIHIYPPANGYLNDPCIGGLMGDYGGWPGVIFMLAIFFMHASEYILSAKLVNKHEADTGFAVKPAQHSEDVENFAVHTSHTHVHGASIGGGMSKNVLSTYLLELCVAMHSITVGLAMGLTPKDETLVLCIAIAFHQLFEGFAIGDRLSRLNIGSDNNATEPATTTNNSGESITVKPTKKGSMKAMFLGSIIYMLAAPLGQAIGMGLHSVFSYKSAGYLITLGILEAASAGILVYVALVNLIAEEFSSFSFRNSSKGKQVAGFIAMYLGAAAMAVIGKWA